jgi:hypothetical protein
MQGRTGMNRWILNGGSVLEVVWRMFHDPRGARNAERCGPGVGGDGAWCRVGVRVHDYIPPRVKTRPDDVATNFQFVGDRWPYHAFARLTIGTEGPVCVRGCPARTGRHPAQRASHSPSQGRRPWWRVSPTTHRQAERADRSMNRTGNKTNCWPVGPLIFVWRPSRPAGPGWGNGWPFGPVGLDGLGFVGLVVVRPQRSIIRPNGSAIPPAIPPAMVAGPGGGPWWRVIPKPLPSGPTGRPFHELHRGDGGDGQV